MAPQLFGDINSVYLVITQYKDRSGTIKDPFPDSPISYFFPTGGQIGGFPRLKGVKKNLLVVFR